MNFLCSTKYVLCCICLRLILFSVCHSVSRHLIQILEFKSRKSLFTEYFVKYREYVLIYGNIFSYSNFTLNVVFVNERLKSCPIKDFISSFSVWSSLTCILYLSIWLSTFLLFCCPLFQVLCSHGQFVLVFISIKTGK